MPNSLGTSDFSAFDFEFSDSDSFVLSEERKDRARSLLDFELHFDISARNVRAVLLQIMEYLSSHKQLHSWDEKLVISPLNTLRATVHRYLTTSFDSSMNILLVHVNVHEVSTVDGVNKAWRVVRESEDIYDHLFFSRSLESHDPVYRCASAQDGSRTSARSSRSSSANIPFAYGRIVNIKDQVPTLQRATLLVLHTFCLQLQSENHGFIQDFIERHINLRSVFKAPERLQTLHIQETATSGNKCYKRVTLSSHLAYLCLGPHNTRDRQGNPLDRLALGQFQASDRTDQETELYLFKTSSSVMLTLVVPEESFSKEEEIGLIESPGALWTVLIANGPPRFTLDYEPLEHLSPCAQFLRGITASFFMQRTNAQHIIGILNDHLQESYNDTLFDDERFTKSRLYHWVIRTCHELSGTVASNLEHVDKVLNGEVNDLIDKAHVHESLGLAHWSKKMKEEINELGRLGAEIQMLREKAQESRNALHGATAVMEARSALQQGEHIQTLTYLATIYLPLSTIASLYSMSVLPDSATFASFFVALAIAFALTLLLGINLSKIRTTIAQDSNWWFRIFLAPYGRFGGCRLGEQEGDAALDWRHPAHPV
ncbi:hypothetical protein N7527_005392 [Penicillium freii]|nr:hypothetical protein N7527_005392 [Penicillium freii]